MNTINKITVSGNTYGIVDTDTKVTSAANHYTPSANNNAELTASLSGTAGAYAKDTEYTVLTGVKAQRDAKGHVTGLTYTAQKIKDTDTNTWRPLGTGSNDACAGNDSRLSNARPASDVSAWAKASVKPYYYTNEVMDISVVSIDTNTSSTCTITTGNAQTIIYRNIGTSDLTVTVPTTYKTPDGAAIELTCPVGGYCEVSYLNAAHGVYARGL